MRRARTIAFAAAIALCAAPAARAAQFTGLVIDTPAVAQPRYSQAIEVVVHLSFATGGAPVPGDACGAGQPCRVQISVGPASDPSTFFAVADPAVDSSGTASTRLTFVDGRYGASSAFVAADDGEPWTLRACFNGEGVAPGAPCQPSPAAACAVGATESADGDLCPTNATRAVELFPEIPTISLGAGFEGQLGTDLTLSATVTDATGDAAPGGTDLDGPQPTILTGVPVTFFYDLDNDGRPSLNESLGTADTNAAGVASIVFPLDPQFVRAGSYDSGIHAEFSGDDRYGVGRSATRLVVRPADVDIAATRIEVEPDTIPADNVSFSVVRVRLVDVFNNLLDITSDPHDVTITTDLGRLLDEVERDPTAGFYFVEVQSTRAPGTATVTVTVDGVPAGTASIEMVGEGCTCRSVDDADGSSTPGVLAAGLLLAALARRRHREGGDGGR